MTTNIAQDLKVLLEETFLKHHGMFTNRGTSLFETLANIDAKDASVHHGKDETIAGHVFHMTFYLDAVTDWDEEGLVLGLLGILAHNAFHLGALRELNS